MKIRENLLIYFLSMIQIVSWWKRPIILKVNYKPITKITLYGVTVINPCYYNQDNRQTFNNQNQLELLRNSDLTNFYLYSFIVDRMTLCINS